MNRPPHTPRRALLYALLLAAGPGLFACAAPADRGQAAAAPLPDGTVRATLDTLRVKAPESMAGYDRVRDFGPAWSDNTAAPGGHDGCDTRDQALRRDLTQVRSRGTSRCVIGSGTLADPYTGRSIAFVRGPGTSAKVQIDHLVSLGGSWQTGARHLTQDQREALAEDPLNLLSADGSANEQKGDGDASAWLPANRAYRCAYVARQVAVKARYSLWVTGPEKKAMTVVLATCPGQALPTEHDRDVAFVK